MKKVSRVQLIIKSNLFLEVWYNDHQQTYSHKKRSVACDIVIRVYVLTEVTFYGTHTND